MIVVTGAVGFIGSCLVSELNQRGIERIIIVDDFSRDRNVLKEHNLVGKKYAQRIDRDEFIEWFKENGRERVKFVFHIGARTDTTETDTAIFDKLNFNYSKDVWKYCVEYKIPLIYASSAATYGMGEHGFDDAHKIVEQLRPLNVYGESKNDFDKWVLSQKLHPPFWAGLKFFNVYGPNEYHKERMASVIFHSYRQILHTGKIKLFKSHHSNYTDGGQLRDFIYVKDLLKILIFLQNNRPQSGLYNVGTGKAKTFKSLAVNTFKAMNREVNIEYIDTPEDIREKYQYFTEAKMTKLITVAGYSEGFHTFEQGIKDYVQNYLMDGKYY